MFNYNNLVSTARISGISPVELMLEISLSSLSFSCNCIISVFNLASALSFCVTSNKPAGLVVRPKIRPEYVVTRTSVYSAEPTVPPTTVLILSPAYYKNKKKCYLINLDVNFKF